MRYLSTLVLLVLTIVALNAQTVTFVNEDFETSSPGNAFPTGWSNPTYGAMTQVSWVIDGTSGYMGSKCAKVAISAGKLDPKNIVLRTPNVLMPQAQDYMLSFKYKRVTGNGSLKIYASTDGGATNGTLLTTLSTTSTDFTDVTVPLTDYKGQTVTIVFYGQVVTFLGQATTFLVDNVVIGTAATCQSPSQISISNTTSTSADFNWSFSGPGTAPDYVSVRVRDDAGNLVFSLDSVASATPYCQVTGLTSGKTYTAWLRGDCDLSSTDDFSDSVSVNFVTIGTAIQPPYFNNFDSANVTDGCTLNSATLNTNPTYSLSGSNSIELATTASADAYIFFPPIALTGNDVEVGFSIRRKDKTSTSQFVVVGGTAVGAMSYNVGYLSDPNDFTTFIPLKQQTLDGGTEWHSYRVNSSTLGIATDTPVIVCIQAVQGQSSSLFVDDIMIRHIPSCLRPENPHAVGSAYNGIELDWEGSNATQYAVRATNGNGFDSTAIATQHPFFFGGLSANTSYTFTVQGICSATDSSDISVPVTVSTLCMPLDSPIFTETFDNIASNEAPQCWTMGWMNKMPGVTATTPFTVNTANVHQGAKSMSVVKVIANTTSYLSTQPLTIDSAGKYDVNIWVFRQAAATFATEGIELWITDNAYDTTGGIRLATIPRHYLSAPAEDAVGWYEYSYNIPVSGIKHLMVFTESQNGAATYFDDLSISLAPSCRKVSKIKAGTVTARTYDISWNAGDDEQQWVVDYTIIKGSSIVTDTTVVTNSPNVTFAGLEPTTNYVVAGNVRALCQVGDTSVAVAFEHTITTICEAINTMPYVTSFETADQTAGTNTLPLCWTRYNNSTSTAYNYYPVNSTLSSYVRTGSQCLQFLSYGPSVQNAPTIQIASLPEVNTSVYPINTLRLKFYGRRTYSNNTYDNANLIVGVMSDPSDASTFVPVDTILLDNLEYKPFIVKLNNYSGTGHYVAMRVNQVQATTNSMIDDVKLDTIPACDELEDAVIIRNVTDTSVVLEVAGNSSWSYGYTVAGGAMTNLTTADVNDTAIVINGLTPRTSYDVYVRRNCGAGIYSAWNDVVTFKTQTTPAAIPYDCGFESAEENGQWQFADGSGDNIFRIGNSFDAVHSGSSALYVTNDNGTTYAYSLTSSSLSYAYRLFEFGASNYQISYEWQATGGESANDWGRVVLVPATEQITGGTGLSMSDMTYPQGTIFVDPTGKDRLNNTTGWNHIAQRIDMTNRAGRYNLVVIWSNNNGNGAQSPLSIDNIGVKEITCLAPENVTYSTLSSDSVVLEIDQMGISQWEVVFDTASFTRDAVPAQSFYRNTTNSSNVTIHGLEQNYVYYCTARAICSEGDTSVWMDPVEIRTYCASFEVPYSDDFETEGTERCWSLVTGSSASSIIERTTTLHHTGLASIKVNGAAVSPEFNVDSLNAYMINGWAYSQEANANFAVGVMVDPNDASTFDVFNTINIPQANRWVEFNAYFTALSDELYADIRNGKHVVFATGNNTIYFDDVNLDLTPTCPRPMELEVTNVTANSFTIDFVDHAGATSWIIYVNGIPQSVNSHPVNITGLNAASDYQVGVASVCSANDTSAMALYGTIRTACDVAAIPYYEGFERLSLSYSYNNPDMISSICWAQRHSSDDEFNPCPRYASTITDGNFTEGGRALQLMGHTFKQLYLYMPEMPVLSRPLRITFDAKAESTVSSGVTSFGYYANPSDTTFTPLLVIPRSTSWAKYEVVADSIPAGARLGFRYGVTDNLGAKSFIDNIIINEVRTCSDPQIPVAYDVVADEATIGFIDTCTTHNSWQYVYGQKGFLPNSATPVAIAENQFTLAGLQPETEYDVYVRAICGTGDESNWIKGSFTTLCIPFAVTTANPFADSFEDLNSGQTLAGCYKVDGNAQSYYRVKGFVNTYSSTLEYHNARTGEMCLIFDQYFSSVPDGQTAYRQFHLEAGHTYQAKVYARANQYHDNKAYLLFGRKANVDSMQILESKTLPVCNGNTTYSTTEIHDYAGCWQEMSNIINITESGNYFIALRADRGETGNNYVNVYFDDLSLVELTGCMPSAVTVDSVSTTTAYCHHNDNTLSAEYEYIVLNNNDTVVGPVSINTQSFTIPNLSPSAEYTVKLRHVCNEGKSVWTKAEFSTKCGAYNIFPVSESFEGNFPPACWSQFSTGTASNAWIQNATSIYCNEGNKSAAIPNATAGTKTVLVTKELNLTSPYGYYVRFWAYRYEDANGSNKIDEALHVSYSNTPVNAVSIATAHEIGLINRHVSKSPAESEGEGFYQYEFEIPAGVTGSTWVTFDFHNQYGGGMYIDDIVIEPIPSCIPPHKGGKVNSVTMTTANIEVDMEGHSNAQIGWALTSAPDDYLGYTLTANGNAVATGLAGATNYLFRYRYICADGDTSAWSPAVTAVTEATDCFKPQSLRTFGITGGRHASITWNRAPLAQNYQYLLTSGGVTVDSAIANVDTVVYTNLTPTTAYTFSVRTFCSDDTTAWESISFTTPAETYQMPFICNFENIVQNNQWVLTNVNGGLNYFTIGTSTNLGGQKSLYITDDGSTYHYTVSSASSATATMLLEIEAGNYSIDYDWFSMAENGSDYGRVFLMPENAALGSFVSTDYAFSLPANAICLDHGQHMSYVNEAQHYTNILNIPTSGVYRFYVLFACTNGLGNTQPFKIDNIDFRQVSCMPVEDVAMTIVRHNHAEAAVSKYSADAVIEYALIDTNDVESVETWLTDSAAAMTTTLSFDSLSQRTQYYLFVRQACSATDRSRVKSLSFTTTMPSVSAPYVCSFEEGEPYINSWTISNGNAAGTNPTAKLVMESTVKTLGDRSLFVTTDSNTYAYKNMGAGVVWDYAYVPVEFTPGAYSITYDWNCFGDGTNDYGRLFLAPTSLSLTGGLQLENLTATTLPAGCISLDNDVMLSGSTGWTTTNVEVSFTSLANYYLVVLWHNDAANGSTSPLAMDNIRIDHLTCPKINENLVSYTSTTTSVTVTVEGNNAGASLGYVLSTSRNITDTVASGVIPAGGDNFTINGLVPSSQYFLSLISLCSADDTSYATVVEVKTLCGVRTAYPYYESFENYVIGSSFKTQMTDNCWIASSASNAYNWITASAGCYYVGSKALAITTGSGTGTRNIVALPEVDTLAGKHISFAYRNPEAGIAAIKTKSIVELGYLSNPGDLTTFVSLETLTDSKAAFTQKSYIYSDSIPTGARAAFRATQAGTAYIDALRINRVAESQLYHDTVCYGSDYYLHGFSCPLGTLIPGDTLLTRFQVSDQPGVADSTIRLKLHVRNEIYTMSYDTTCAGQPYHNGYWNLANPQTRTYTHTWHGDSTASGCDSMVSLSLYVVPTSHTVYDTICKGNTYTIYGQNFTATGNYSVVGINQYGCNDTVALHLFVVDTLSETYATVCNGYSYSFMGSNYNIAGTYDVVRTGQYGCPLTHRLHLTVLPTDSTVNVTFCHGGQVTVANLVITESGTYTTIVPAASQDQCDMTYHITATMDSLPVVGDVYDIACEGHQYIGHGINGLDVISDTTVFIQTRTNDALCDSTTAIHFTFHPTQYSEETVVMPSDGYYEWYDNSYSKPGDYHETLHDSFGCDSILTLHLIEGPTGVENVADIHLDIVPNPVETGSSALVYGNYDKVIAVEILNNLGQTVDSFVPQSYPIEVPGLSAAGLYYVRVITEEGKVHVQKLIVK